MPSSTRCTPTTCGKRFLLKRSHEFCYEQVYISGRGSKVECREPIRWLRRKWTSHSLVASPRNQRASNPTFCYLRLSIYAAPIFVSPMCTFERNIRSHQFAQ